MELQLRDKIDNQYLITEKHYGGMSVVYIVLDEFSQRRFAVKSVKEELLNDRSVVSRFAAEARTWMNLGRHENIVEAIIYREIEGQPYLFLEYVDGTDLQRLMDAERRLYPPQVLRFAKQACAGMAYVHQAKVGPGNQGLIHRDLKPANLMITRAGSIKITDFGLAKVQGMPSAHVDVGVGLGTYLYMPPEQLLDASTADRTSDVYSLGVCLYTSLTGRPPLTGADVNALVRSIINQDPIAPSRVVSRIPQSLDAIVLRCLAKAREDRYPGFPELLHDLEAVEAEVQEAFRSESGILRCRTCGYWTVHSYHSCPICADVFESYIPEAASSLTQPAQRPVTPPPAPADDPQLQAANDLLTSARALRAQGDLLKATNLLRQVQLIAPDHVEARRELDEMALEQARNRPKTPGRAYNWPMHRGNIARTGYTPEAVLPPLTRKWQHRVGEWVLASPVVANGLVVIGGKISQPGIQGRLVALQANTGQLMWEQEYPNEVILSATVLGGSTAYICFGSRLAAIDMNTGVRLWEFSSRTPITSSPTVSQHIIYVGTEDGFLFALQSQTGKLLWSFQTEMAIYSAAMIWEKTIIFGSCDHRVYALNRMSGDLIWSMMTGSEVFSTPAFHAGRVYVGSYDHRLYCLDYHSGRPLWEFETEAPVSSSPAAYGELIYVGSRDKCVYAVDASTGARRWHYATGDWVDSSPAISGQVVYVGSHDHSLYALEAQSGVLLWEYQTDDEVASSPAISAGKVFVGSKDGAVYCFKANL